MLHWRDATGAGAEVISRTTRDFGRNLPPHPSFAAALLQHVLCALVYDDGDELMLTLGARRTWWRGARLRAVPTRWGVIDVSFSLDHGMAEWRWTPVPVPTVLRLPPGTQPAAGAGMEARRIGDGYEIRVPAGRKEVSLRVEEISPR